MKYDIGNVITVDNYEQYIIFSKINYNNTNYYYIIGYDEIKNDINGICKIIKIVKEEQDDCIELVNNKNELAQIIPLFKEFYA